MSVWKVSSSPCLVLLFGKCRGFPQNVTLCVSAHSDICILYIVMEGIKQGPFCTHYFFHTKKNMLVNVQKYRINVTNDHSYEKL